MRSRAGLSAARDGRFPKQPFYCLAQYVMEGWYASADSLASSYRELAIVLATSARSA
jgi:hypothetical protein